MAGHRGTLLDTPHFGTLGRRPIDAAVDGARPLAFVDASARQCEAVAGCGRVGVSGLDVFLHPGVVAVVEVPLPGRPRDDAPGEMPERGFAAVAEGRAAGAA